VEGLLAVDVEEILVVADGGLAGVGHGIAVVVVGVVGKVVVAVEWPAVDGGWEVAGDKEFVVVDVVAVVVVDFAVGDVVAVVVVEFAVVDVVAAVVFAVVDVVAAVVFAVVVAAG